MTRHEFEKRISATKVGSTEEQKAYDDLLADLENKRSGSRWCNSPQWRKLMETKRS